MSAVCARLKSREMVWQDCIHCFLPEGKAILLLPVATDTATVLLWNKCGKGAVRRYLCDHGHHKLQFQVQVQRFSGYRCRYNKCLSPVKTIDHQWYRKIFYDWVVLSIFYLSLEVKDLPSPLKVIFSVQFLVLKTVLSLHCCPHKLPVNQTLWAEIVSAEMLKSASRQKKDRQPQSHKASLHVCFFHAP